MRQKRIQEVEAKVQTVISEQPISDFKDKEYLSFKEAATLLGLSKQAIYKMVYAGKLQAFRISSRLSFIRRDIDRMLEARPYEQRQPKDTIPITDFYTTAEVKEKYHVNESWIFVVAKKNNIPRTFNRGKTYWSKKHIDAYFAQKTPNPDITEWYNTQEMQEKFGMTLSAIYTFVSKKHVDVAEGMIAPEEPQYYMVAEAMKKFNLTRDQLYHYAKYHNIPKVKKGKYTLISKSELDKLLNPKTMQMSRREYLGIYIYAHPKNEMERKFNNDMLNKAEAIRCIRVQSLINEEFDFLDKTKQKADFLAYFKKMCRSKDQKWTFVYQHFYNFVKGQCTFGEVNVDLCKKFREYLLNAKQLKHSNRPISLNSASSYYSIFRGLLKIAYRDKWLRENINDYLDKIEPQDVKKE